MNLETDVYTILWTSVSEWRLAQIHPLFKNDLGIRVKHRMGPHKGRSFPPCAIRAYSISVYTDVCESVCDEGATGGTRWKHLSTDPWIYIKDYWVSCATDQCWLLSSKTPVCMHVFTKQSMCVNFSQRLGQSFPWNRSTRLNQVKLCSLLIWHWR